MESSFSFWEWFILVGGPILLLFFLSYVFGIIGGDRGENEDEG